MLYIKEHNDNYILPNEETIINNNISLNNYTNSLIYFLIKDDKIIYVGKSKQGFKRIFEHKKDFDSFTYIECDESILDVLETIYIERFKPICNSQSGNCKSYEKIKKFKIETIK